MVATRLPVPSISTVAPAIGAPPSDARTRPVSVPQAIWLQFGGFSKSWRGAVSVAPLSLAKKPRPRLANAAHSRARFAPP